MHANRRPWRSSYQAVACAAAAAVLFTHESSHNAAAATTNTSAQQRLTTPFICTSAAFLDLPSTLLGSSPLTIKSLVQRDQVCIEVALPPNASTSINDNVGWFAVGLSRTGEMVSDPPASVLLFQPLRGVLESYVLGGRSTNAVTRIDSNNSSSSFVVASASVSTRSFTYQRLLAAATSTDVAIDVTQPMHMIWAFGAAWPLIGGHRRGTRGTALYRFASPVQHERDNATDSNDHDSNNNGNRNTNSKDELLLYAHEPFCLDKNCAAIVGGAALAFLLISGLVITRLLAHTALARLLLFHTLAAPPVHATTNKRPTMSLLTQLQQTLADLKVGEALVVFTFVGTVAALVALLIDADTNVQVITGSVALLVLLFILLPVTRLPLWSLAFGSSFERIVKFHRWLGFALTITTVVHLVLALKLTNVTQTEPYGSVTPVYGFIAFVAFAVMTLLSVDAVRRVAFEVFYITHRVLAVVGLVFAVLHAPKVIGLALIVPLALHVGSIVLQRVDGTFTPTLQANIAAVRVRNAVVATTLVLRPSEQTIALAARLKPGAFFWIKLPATSRNQWHPFFAIATRDGQSIGFCVQARGGIDAKKTFTNALALEALQKHVVAVRLCGPFGNVAVKVDVYDTIVLLAGGIGITPIVSLVNQKRLHRALRVHAQMWHVVWSVKYAEALLVVDDFMPSIAESVVSPPPPQLSLSSFEEPPIEETTPATAPVLPALVPTPSRPLDPADAPALLDATLTLKWSLHVSSATKPHFVTRQSGERLPYTAGRPILTQVVHPGVSKRRGRVAVVACGPPTLVAEAQALARACGFDFHKESFHW